MKKIYSFLLISLLLMGSLLLVTETVALADGNSDSVTLEMITTWTGEKKVVLSQVLDDFTLETGINVELVSPGSNYETVMKTRMASYDLPDIWETHGWSVERYSEYLMTLNNQDWFSRVDDAIIPVISDEDDNIYVLPLTMGINTISYNKDAFEKAGVDAASIRTWDDFNTACEKLLKAGITPISVGNKNGTAIAQLAEAIPPTFLTNKDLVDNQAASLKNGTFDFKTYWTPIAELVDYWVQKGYFNVDILTADNETACKALGAGKAAMVFGGSNNITTALTFYPAANLGLLAIPSVKEDGKSSLSMGEGSCYGIWNDTDYKKEALRLFDYLAQPEIVSKIATVGGDLPAFSDVENKDDYITVEYRKTVEMFKGDILFNPIFDREYLPSGMWNDLGITFTQLIMAPGKEINSSVTYLEEAYLRKIKQ